MAMCIMSSLLHVFDTSQVSLSYYLLSSSQEDPAIVAFIVACRRKIANGSIEFLVVTKDYNFFSILATGGKATFRSYSFTIPEENVPAPNFSLLQGKKLGLKGD